MAPVQNVCRLGAGDETDKVREWCCSAVSSVRFRWMVFGTWIKSAHLYLDPAQDSACAWAQRVARAPSPWVGRCEKVAVAVVAAFRLSILQAGILFRLRSADFREDIGDWSSPPRSSCSNSTKRQYSHMKCPQNGTSEQQQSSGSYRQTSFPFVRSHMVSEPSPTMPGMAT